MLLLLGLLACTGDKGTTDTGTPESRPDDSGPDDSTPDDSDPGDSDPVDTGPMAVLTRAEGFSTPEGVRCEDGLCYVSNISGAPDAHDGDGSIATVSTDDQVVSPDVFPDVSLDAPKGMAVWEGVLYVTDIDRIVAIPLDGAASSDSGVVDGAVFLNDVVAGEDGTLYISDSSGDAIYTWDRSGAVALLTSEITAPNGLTIYDGSLYALASGKGQLCQISLAGVVGTCWDLPNSQLDGVEVDADGQFYVTSWRAKAVYQGTPGGDWTAVASDLTSPADLGLDRARGRLYVPLFNLDSVVVLERATGG